VFHIKKIVVDGAVIQSQSTVRRKACRNRANQINATTIPGAGGLRKRVWSRLWFSPQGHAHIVFTATVLPGSGKANGGDVEATPWFFLTSFAIDPQPASISPTVKISIIFICVLLTEIVDGASAGRRSSARRRDLVRQAKCCQYTKHFTKTVPLEATGRCPRCKNIEFRPVR
jgi:hypothetical protein